MTKQTTTKWTALNLLAPSVQEIVVRKGDSVMFTAAQADAQNVADIELSVNDNDYDLQFIPGKAVGKSDAQAVDANATAIGDKLTYKFTKTGEYVINANYNPRGGGKNKGAVAGTAVKVTVVEAKKPSVSPAFMIGEGRAWTLYRSFR